MVSLRAFCLLALSTLMLAGCASRSSVPVHPGSRRPTGQAVTVRVPTQLHVYTINGKKVNGVNAFSGTGYNELKLAPGHDVIIAGYDERWNVLNIGSDAHQVYQSDPVKFIVDGESGDDFELGYKRPQSSDQAEKLANHFSGWTVNMATGEKTPTQPSGLVLERGILSSIVGVKPKKADGNHARPRGRQIVATEGRITKAAKARPAHADNIVKSPAAQAAPQAVLADSYLNTLKAEWNQATAKERREFLQWLSNSK